MKLSDIGEDAFLREIEARFPARKGVPIGIGDDAACLDCEESVLITVDTLVEGQHFTIDNKLPPKFIGKKATSVSASDIAAMGGICNGLLLSFITRGDLDVELLWEILEGASQQAELCGMTLVGGNLSGSYGPMSVTSTVLGKIQSGSALRRNGARNGDGIYLSGDLGAAACGLRLLQNGVSLSTSEIVIPEGLGFGSLDLVETCIHSQVDPQPRLKLGRELSLKGIATSCIDTSDGLVLDLTRLCRASGVQARIEEDTLPLSKALVEWQHLGFEAMNLALFGGEDYELLFTMSDDSHAEVLRHISDVSITRIGEIVESLESGESDRTVEIVRSSGCVEGLDSKGWDHFKVG